MPFIYRTDDKTYFNGSNKWVESLALAANYKSLDKANNFIKSNPVLKALMEQELLQIIENEAFEMSNEDADEAFKILQKTAEVFGEAAQKISSLRLHYNNIITEQDRIQQDILHKFEFTKPNGLMYFRLGKMLHDCRKTRREAKNVLLYLSSLGPTIPEKIYQVHNNSIEGLENMKYEPRALPELFN